MVEKSDFQLEHDLDAWWDGVAANEHSVDDPEPPRVDVATVRYLTTHHTGSPPDPTLVHELKERLMQGATISTSVTEIPVGSDIRGEPATTRVPRPFWPTQRRRLRGLTELAAVAVLALIFLGGAFGDGPFGGLHNLLPLADEPTGDTGPVGMYRGNAARTGVASEPGPTGPPALRWQGGIGDDWARPSAVGAGEWIYFINGDQGEVSARDASTGDVYWVASVGRILNSAPAVGNGLVYVATAGPAAGGADAGYLIALDATTGNERWRYETGGSANSSPALDGDTLYVATVDNSLRAIVALTGKERWRFDFAQYRPATPVPGNPSPVGDDQSIASPAVAGGLVYVANSSQVIAIDAQDGRERWRFQVDGNSIATPAVVDKTVYFTTTGGAAEWAYAVDATTGNQRWRVEAHALGASAPAVAEGLLFLHSHATAEGEFVALDAASGATVWTHQTGGSTSDLVYAGGVVYGTSTDGKIFALSATSGQEIWQVDTGNGSILGPTVIKGKVIVPSNIGDVYAIGSAQPGATPVSNDGALVDISGLPPCEPPRQVSPDELTGTPAATLLPPVSQNVPASPQMKLTEIPQGEPPSGEAFAGILETLRGMAACSRPRDVVALQGYFTDDYFRREWVQKFRDIRYPGGYESTGASLIWGADGKPATSLNDARALPDGRIGVVVMSSDKVGTYAIFVEQDGHWLIDERYELSDEIGRG